MARWRGRERLKQLAARLPPEIRAADQAAVREGMGQLAEAIRRKAPIGVDEPFGRESGALKGSVRFGPGSKPWRWRVAAGGAATTVQVRKGAERPYDYSRGVEFGHMTPKGAHEPAHPFFFPTWRAFKPVLRRMRGAAIRAAVKRLAGNWAK